MANANLNAGSFKANAVSDSKPNKKGGNKGLNIGPKKNKGTFKKKNVEGKSCYVCGTNGHFARDCRYRKGANNKNAAYATKMDDDEIIAAVSEVMVVQGKVPGWWYDTCATVHVSYDKSLDLC